MPRQPRVAPGGIVYHVLNRANGRNLLFEKPQDFEAFERLMLEAMKRFPTRLLGYCLMGTHWHMALWPREDGEMTAFLRWLTMTHSQRVHAHRHTTGWGHVYQGRFKSFPIERDEHLLTVVRYMERNPLRANLVKRAQNWRWSSLWRREHGDEDKLLSPMPIELPEDWVLEVNRAQTDAEVEALRRSIRRGTPFGSEAWVERMVKKLKLDHTVRPRGRPRLRGT